MKVEIETNIRISECLKRLEAGELAELEVYEYDRNRGTGGEIKRLVGKLVTGIERPETHLNGREMTESEREEREKRIQELGFGTKKSPHHSEWYTRNLRIYADNNPTSIIVKIHPPLIRSFNSVLTVP